MRRSLSLKAAALRLVRRLTEMVIMPAAWNVWALLGSDSWVRSSEIACVQVSLKSRSRRGLKAPRAIGVSAGDTPSYRPIPCAPTWQPPEPVGEAVVELEASARAQEQPHARVAHPVHSAPRRRPAVRRLPDLVLLERVEDDV